MSKQMIQLQRCELLIADEIKRICERNKIRYFLIAGSMLGAIRHAGFIPWDDDMDFGMLREDYELFRKACQKELADSFFFVDWDNDDDYPFSYGKVMLKGTHIEELFAPEGKTNQSVFVDVFPYDHVPRDIKKQKRQANIVFFLRRVLWVKKGYGRNIRRQGILQRLKYDTSKVAFMIVPYRIAKRRLKKVITQYNSEESQFVFMDSPYSYRKSQINIDWINHITGYSFEDRIFPGFVNAHEYLTFLYGDYEKLPPESERNNHEILSVDLGQFETIENNQ